MITSGEFLKELDSLKKKAEFAQITYPGNDIWPVVNSKLSEITELIKSDRRMFRYN